MKDAQPNKKQSRPLITPLDECLWGTPLSNSIGLIPACALGQSIFGLDDVHVEAEFLPVQSRGLRASSDLGWRSRKG